MDVEQVFHLRWDEWQQKKLLLSWLKPFTKKTGLSKKKRSSSRRREFDKNKWTFNVIILSYKREWLPGGSVNRLWVCVDFNWKNTNELNRFGEVQKGIIEKFSEWKIYNKNKYWNAVKFLFDLLEAKFFHWEKIEISSMIFESWVVIFKVLLIIQQKFTL